MRTLSLQETKLSRERDLGIILDEGDQSRPTIKLPPLIKLAKNMCQLPWKLADAFKLEKDTLGIKVFGF